MRYKFSFIAIDFFSFTEWAKKTAHGFHCNNFVYSQSIFIMFGTYTIGNLQLDDA